MSRWAAAWRATVGELSPESAVSTDTEAQERASQGESVSSVSSVTAGEIDSDYPDIHAEPLDILATVALWPDYLRDAFEERAAIVQYEGAMARRDAERAAFDGYRVAMDL